MDEDLAQENARLRDALIALQSRIEELERLADTDTLTPLPNRRRFLRELERMVALAGRLGTPAALLYIDIDSLKAINDSHGHGVGVGDAALVHVAGLLARLVRSSDLAARVGGDEFALILDHLDQTARSKRPSGSHALSPGIPWRWMAPPFSSGHRSGRR